MGWTSVSYTVTRNNAVVQGLLDGKGYFFRIAAENIIGMGPFIETDKMVLIKDPICTSHARTVIFCPIRFINKGTLSVYVTLKLGADLSSLLRCPPPPLPHSPRSPPIKTGEEV